jgi:hypothetical protein
MPPFFEGGSPAFYPAIHPAPFATGRSTNAASKIFVADADRRGEESSGQRLTTNCEERQ